MFKDEDIVSKKAWLAYFIYYSIPKLPESCVLLNVCTDEYKIFPIDGLSLIKGNEYITYINSKNLIIGSQVTTIGQDRPGEIVGYSKDFAQSAMIQRFDGNYELVHKKLLRLLTDEELTELYKNKTILVN